MGYPVRFMLLLLPFLAYLPLNFGQSKIEGGGDPVRQILRIAGERELSLHRPVLSPDGRTLLFARPGHPQNLGGDNREDIWISYRDTDHSWSRPVNLGAPLNDEQSNLPVFLNPKGNVLYFMSLPDGDRRTAARLYRAERHGRSWAAPRPVGLPELPGGAIPTDFCLSIDERFLLIVAHRPERPTDGNLFVAFRKGPYRWERPINLGPTLNSTANENGPYLAADGKTLYFASDGHGGEGGMDIWATTRQDDSWRQWSKPVNLGPRVNSAANDRHFTLPASGAFLYLATEKGPQNDLLYRVELPPSARPEPVVLVRGRLGGSKGDDRLVCQPLKPRAAVQKVISTTAAGNFQFIAPLSQNLTVYARTDSAMAISQVLPLNGQPIVAPETAGRPLSPELSGNLGYQKRRQSILEIRRKMHRAENRLDSLQWRKNQSYRQDPAQRVGALPQQLFDRDTIQALKKAYNRQIFRTQELLVKGGEDAQPASPEDRMARLRRQFHRSRDRKTGTTPEQATTDKAGRPIAFETFAQRIWDRLAAEEAARLRPEMEEKILREYIRRAGRKDAVPPELRGRRRISDRSAQLMDTLPPLPGAEPWLKEMKATLKDIFRPEMQMTLEQALSPLIYQLLEIEIAYLREEDRLDELEGQVTKLLQKQWSEEADAASPRQKERPRSVAKAEQASDASFREIEIKPAITMGRPGTIIPLNSVFFQAGTDVLLRASYSELDRLTEFLRKHPDKKIEIRTRVSGALAHSYALEITTRRANAIVQYLEEGGVEKSRILHRGMGLGSKDQSSTTQMVEVKIRVPGR